MPNWRELLHNRWVWLGGAGAAGLGAITWWRRRGTGGTGGALGAASGSPAYTAAGAVGGFDSTGTDVAHWLGDYSKNLDQQFNEFKGSVEEKLATIPAATAATGTGAPTVANNPAAAPAAANPATSSLYLAPGTNLYQVVDQVRAANPGFSLQQLEALNPGIRNDYYWRAGSGSGPYGSAYSALYGKIAYNKTAQTVTIR